ncbi:hypothetical protein [Faecalitalea cylindroides]|uniref:hypothetical protein n=1 Tax=Faecalitalea cylindroides TaxID=39483 RepID=UPI002E78E01F|nr:hypothetical protein [Faecalitalea cylindroides]MEE1449670.1 hypothetical protein [Faecalitalea cylindroides]
MNKKNTFYAIYDNDDCIRFVGTSKECASFLGITLQSFYTVVTKGLKKKYHIYSIK